jgi:hypothetical protein
MRRLIALEIAMDDTFKLRERVESVISAFIVSTLVHLPGVLGIVNLGILFLRYVRLYALLGSLAVASWIALWSFLYTKSLRKKTIGSTIPLEKVAVARSISFFVIVFSLTMFILNETLIQFF